MKRLKSELVFKLLLGVFIGIALGLVANETVMNFIVVIKDLLGQIIFFTVPLIILGFVAPSIAELKSGATKLLGFAVGIAYLSTLGAATFSMICGYILVPLLNIQNSVEGLRELPLPIFSLQITPIMSVMSALVLSLMLGLAVSATKSTTFETLLNEFRNIVLKIVSNLILPILPFFIGTTFMSLAYEGSITKHLPIFIIAIIIVIIGHFIWLIALYFIAGKYAKVNPKEVYKYYAPAYFTAVGTMSSAATMPVALTCAKKSPVLHKDSVEFGIPLFANIHLCGSVLTEVFFVMTVSQVLYGQLPGVGEMIVFVVLLGVFGIGAPGVPGGTVMASLGLITGVLGFDAEGTALMMTIFALQDSFGTACNVTGDGALTLILSKFTRKITAD
nr:dicarboxylate/amino acid:cation symporter [Candidatus Epulopiscium viviparus]